MRVGVKGGGRYLDPTTTNHFQMSLTINRSCCCTWQQVVVARGQPQPPAFCLRLLLQPFLSLCLCFNCAQLVIRGLNVRLLNAIFVARRAARTCTGPIGHKVRFIFVDFPLLAFCKRAWAQLLPTSRLLLPGLAPSTVHYLVTTVRSPALSLPCSALLCESPSDAVVTLCTLLRVREPSSNHNATR